MVLRYASEFYILAIFLTIFLVPHALGFETASPTAQTENKSSNLTEASPNETVGWKTYEDGENHYKMQYPQEWKTYESDLPIASRDFAITPDVETDPLSIASKTLVAMHVSDISKSLDPATLKVQSVPLSEYANEEIAGLSSGGEPNIIRNEAITVSGQPAWRVDYIHNYKGYQLSYGSTLFVVKDAKLYKISFVTAPLKVEETRPVGEKILQTFQFTINTGTFQYTNNTDNFKVTDTKDEQSKNDDVVKDCSDFDKKNFKVQPGDPYDLDPDRDGIAGEG